MRALDTALTASLPGRLDSLRDSLDAAMVRLEDLPEELKQRWVSPQGSVRIEVFPRGNLNDSEVLRRFVSELRSVKSDVSGVPVNYLEGGRAVVTSFQQAFLYSFLIITVVLAVFMERKRDIVLVLTPLLLAALLTGTTAVVLGSRSTSPISSPCRCSWAWAWTTGTIWCTGFVPRRPMTARS